MLSDNIRDVRERIANAAAKAGRDAAVVQLIAVSKTHPEEMIVEAIDAGQTAFGENRVREAETKIDAIGRGRAEWHLIGHLQSNKARRAVRLFDVIHSVDSIELATRLDRICVNEAREELRVLIQVDLGGESTKSGVDESDLVPLIDTIKGSTRLRLIGFMTLPPFFDDPQATRPFFRRLREIRDEFLPGGELSMGMSHDLEVAIAEGSTMVRVGTDIFGRREPGASHE